MYAIEKTGNRRWLAPAGRVFLGVLGGFCAILVLLARQLTSRPAECHPALCDRQPLPARPAQTFPAAALPHPHCRRGTLVARRPAHLRRLQSHRPAESLD